MAAISGGRANDERVKCLRIFADGNGETHMEDMDITLQPKKLFKDTPPLGLTENLPASWYNICYVPKDTGGNGLAQSAAATACALANRRGRIRDERWRHLPTPRRQRCASGGYGRQGAHYPSSP
jgi:hypothetical protein